jgi:zinc protease
MTGAMVRRGGTAKRSPDDFDEAVDFLGTEIDTRAGPTRAGASLDCLTETLEESLALFFEMLGHPGFETGRLEGIESNLLAGFLARNDDPIAVMEREWSWLLVGTEHHLGRQLTGADLAAIERKDLVEFHGRYWRPERAVLAVSGDVRAERVLPLLEAGIARWRESLPPEGAAPPWPPPGLPREAAPGIYLAGHVSGQDSGQASGQDSSQRSSQASPQAKVSVGHGLEPIRDWLSRDAAALEAANEILGGTRGQMSRINGRLRGQGLVYRALSELDTGVYEPGSFRIFLDASPESVLGAVETCLAELDRLISTGVAAAELDAVREELLSGLTLRFDTAQETAGYFAEDLLLGRPHEYWYGYEKRLLALEPRDLQAAAARHLDPEKLKVLVVGGEESPAPSGARDPRLTRWLGRPHRLPARDPVTLEPLAAPARAGC